MSADLVLLALLMPVWWPKADTLVIEHSVWGLGCAVREWSFSLQQCMLEPGMSRRGSWHGNLVAGSTFHLPKQERMRHRTYLTRGDLR